VEGKAHGWAKEIVARFRPRLTYANVVATLALFLVLGGGSALAAYVINSNADIAPNTVSGHDPPAGDHANVIGQSINSQDLAPQGVSSGRLATDAVNSAKVLNDSLTGSDIDESSLNVDITKLDGYNANQLARIGQASDEDLLALGSTDTRAQVTITVPKRGFVKVDGSTLFEDAFSPSFCAPCIGAMRVHDDAANVDSPASLIDLDDASGDNHYTQLSRSWVFPASAGSHTYSLTTAQSATGGPAAFDNPVLTAQFIPFNGTGSATGGLGPQASKVASGPRRAAPGGAVYRRGGR
jgi:hypothetical protein